MVTAALISKLQITAKLLLVLICLIFFLATSPNAFAAVGIYERINFQGKLVNDDGTNVSDGNFSITFTLYDGPNGGAANLWDEVQTVAVADGVFRVELGSVDNSIANVDFNQNTLYLGVKVGTDTEMTPRVRFAAVPYAFMAEKVNGLSVTNNGSNTLDIATGLTLTVSTANKTLTGAGTQISIGNNISFGSGTTGTITLGDSSNSLDFSTTGNTAVTLPTSGTLFSSESTSAEGDLIYASANNTLTMLNKGGDGDCLKSTALTLQWGTCSSATSLALHQLTDAENSNSISNGAHTQTWQWAFTGADQGLVITESADSTGGSSDQFLVDLSTAAGGTSTGSPLRVTNNSADSGDIIFNLAQSGDLLLQDAGTTFVSFGDDGVTTVSDDLSLSLTNSENLEIAYVTTAPGVDMVTVTNTGVGTTTDLVDGLAISLFTSSDAGADTNSAIHAIIGNTAQDSSDVLNGLEITGSAQTVASSTQNLIFVDPAAAGNTAGTLYGVNIDGLTGNSATEVALNIGSGWDTDILFGDTSPLFANNSASADTLAINNSGAGSLSLNLTDGGLSTASTSRLTNAGVLENITGLTVLGVSTVNSSGSSAVNIGTGSYTGTVTVGNTSGNLALADNNWSVSAAGDANFVTFQGSGLSADCSGSTDKILWSSSSNTFTCGSDNGSTIQVVDFTDSTADTSVSFTSATDIWDGTYSNITPGLTTNKVMISANIRGTSDDANDQNPVFTLRRTIDGSAPSCSSTTVGSEFVGGFLTATTQDWGANATFLDSPGVDTIVRYTVCTTTTGADDGTVDVVNIILTELGPLGGAGGGSSLTVRETDGSPSVATVSTIEFGPATTSSDEFIVTDETGGTTRIRIGDQVGMLNQTETVTAGWTFSAAVDINAASTVAGLTVDGGGTLSATGAVTLGDGSGADTIILDKGSGNITFTGFTTCTALETNASGNLQCGTDDGGTTLEWSSLIAPTTDLSINHDEWETVFTWNTADTAADTTGLTLGVTNDASSDATTQRALSLVNNSASGGTTEGLLYLNNADNNAVTSAIHIDNTGSGNFTNLFNIQGTTISVSEFTILDSGIALSELTDSGTLTAGTVDINGGNIDGTVLGAAVRAAASVTTLDANGTVQLGDGSGSDNITLSKGAGSITLTSFVSCTALETDGSGVLSCGVDNDSGASPTLDAIQQATADSGVRDSDNNTLNWNWDFTTAAVDSGLNISESTASTNGTQDQQALVEISTLSGSTASPLQVTSAGTDVGDIWFNLASSGDLEIRDNGTPFVTFSDNGSVTFGSLTNDNAVLYTNSTGVLQQTATGGAGTLCLVSANGGTPTWGSCSGTASTVWSSLTAPTNNTSLNHGEFASTFTWDTNDTTAAAFNGLTLAISNDAGADSDTQRILSLVNNSASGGTTESLFYLNNADNNVVTTAIQIANSGGGNFTNILDVNGTLLSGSEITILDSGLALSELTDSGTLTAGTVDINGGNIDGTVLGAAVRAAASVTTMDANGTVQLGDGSGSDNITLSRGSGDITLTGFTTCTALETNGSGVLSCGSDDTGGGSVSLDQLVAATTDSSTLDSNANTLNWNWDFTSAGNDSGFRISESTASTNGAQDEQALAQFSTLAGSTASPFRIISNSADVGDIFFNLASDGDFEIRDNGVTYATFADDGTVSLGKASADSTLNFGTGSGVDTIHIGDGSGADVITIGNSNASATVAITGGDDWAITAAGAATFDSTVTLGDGSGADNITLSRGSGNIVLTGFTTCTALETDSSGNLVCGTDDNNNLPNTERFTDSVADTSVSFTSATDVWDGTNPNITPAGSSNTVLISVVVRGVSDDAADQNPVFIVTRTTDGSDPTCGSTQVGVELVGSYLTAATQDWGTSAVFIDSPGTTNNVQYTVCTSSTGADDGTVNDITVHLAEMGADLAENYYTKDTSVQAGNIVSIDPSLPAGVKKSSKAYDMQVLGIVSTAPGMVLDDYIGRDFGKPVPVALSGRVPVKVTTESGAINPGDLLTSSSTPGVAMKATKAGQIVGQAMTGFAGEGVGSVFVFVKTDYWAGASSFDLLSEDSTSDQNQPVGVRLLKKLMEQPLANVEMDASEVYTDRVLAGLEVVTPRVVADQAVLRSFSPLNGEEISLELGEKGKFTINGAEGQVITFNSKGDVHISGILTADMIRANKIEGLSLVEDRLKALEDKVASMSAAVAGEATQSAGKSGLEAEIAAILAGREQEASTASVEANPSVVSISDLQSEGLATDSGMLNTDKLFVKNESVFSGFAQFLESITTRNLIVTEWSRFLSEVFFKGDVWFEGRPTFNKDTAGFAQIQKDQTEVEVVFEEEYQTAPVVSANVTVARVEDPEDPENKKLSDKYFAQDVRFVVQNVSTKGFTLRLNKTAVEDLDFSWIALAVKDPIIAKNTASPSPSGTPSPSPSVPPPVESIKEQEQVSAQPSPTPQTAAVAPPPQIAAQTVKIVVRNGTVTGGLAQTKATELKKNFPNLEILGTGNTFEQNYQKTQVYYESAESKAAAESIAGYLNGEIIESLPIYEQGKGEQDAAIVILLGSNSL